MSIGRRAAQIRDVIHFTPSQMVGCNRIESADNVRFAQVCSLFRLTSLRIWFHSRNCNLLLRPPPCFSCAGAANFLMLCECDTRPHNAECCDPHLGPVSEGSFSGGRTPTAASTNCCCASSSASHLKKVALSSALLDRLAHLRVAWPALARITRKQPNASACCSSKSYATTLKALTIRSCSWRVAFARSSSNSKIRRPRTSSIDKKQTTKQTLSKSVKDCEQSLDNNYHHLELKWYAKSYNYITIFSPIN